MAYCIELQVRWVRPFFHLLPQLVVRNLDDGLVAYNKQNGGRRIAFLLRPQTHFRMLEGPSTVPGLHAKMNLHHIFCDTEGGWCPVALA